MKSAYLYLLATTFSISCFSQSSKQFADSNINAVLRAVQDNYVFPDVAKRISAYVGEQKAAGVYDTVSSGKALAAMLTMAFREVSHDLHLRVSYSGDKLPSADYFQRSSDEQKVQLKKMMELEHFGIKSKQVLPGNIGYLNITVFGPIDLVADSLAAAMNELAGTQALIIDLRECHGSMDPSTIPFLSGYFFAEPVHLNDFYNRASNDTVQSWSYGWVPGKRYLSKPVYILTSGGTFSGGEEFAYDFKSLKRALIIGETTGGGANPGGTIRANDHFEAFVPTGTAVNPITKTNWEGVGVRPDSTVRSSLALLKARELALKTLLLKADERSNKKYYEDLIASLASETPAFTKVTFTLKGFSNASYVSVAGNFNGWSPKATPLRRDREEWIVTTDVEKGKLLYKFVVDGRWITDPANAATETDGTNVNSVKFVQ